MSAFQSAGSPTLANRPSTVHQQALSPKVHSPVCSHLHGGEVIFGRRVFLHLLRRHGRRRTNPSHGLEKAKLSLSEDGFIGQGAHRGGGMANQCLHQQTRKVDVHVVWKWCNHRCPPQILHTTQSVHQLGCKIFCPTPPISAFIYAERPKIATRTRSKIIIGNKHPQLTVVYQRAFQHPQETAHL